MATLKLLLQGTTTAINKDAALTNGSRAAGDLDNSTNLDVWGIGYLTVQFDTTAPSAGATIAEVYLITGDGGGTEIIPSGGDGTVGSDADPQPALLIARITTVLPSTSVNEILQTNMFRLGVDTNRFVVKNVSGQQFDETWQFDVVTYKLQSV